MILKSLDLLSIQKFKSQVFGREKSSEISQHVWFSSFEDVLFENEIIQSSPRALPSLELMLPNLENLCHAVHERNPAPVDRWAKSHYLWGFNMF